MTKVSNERVVYNLLNLVSDVGGFASPILGFGIFLGQAYGSMAFFTHIIEAVFLSKELKPLKFTFSSMLACIRTKQRVIWRRGQKKIEN